MRWIIYYTVVFVLNVTSLVMFHRYINIIEISVVPILLMLLAIFLAFYYHRNKECETTYSVGAGITNAEWDQVTSYTMYCYLISIPLFFPFIWFFSSWIKWLSVLIFLIAFAGGSIVFRIKHGKELRARYDKENLEFQKQKKKEEMGLWK